MHVLSKQLLKFVLLLSVLTYAGCSDDDGPITDDDDEVTLTGETKTYPLGSVSDPNISGTATFAELSDGSTTITLDLTGTPDDGEHPAHIHANSAAEGGDIVVSLTPVDGASGESVTTVTETDAGDAITYDELLAYDGYINVHLSASELSTLVAQGDIGINELTGETKVYELEERDVAGISGTATFAERVSGEALATLALAGTPDDGEHPAHIHMNSAAEGGNIVFTFTPVNGATGMSMTHVAALDDGTAFGYSDVLEYDGYINVHLSAEELATIVAQGNIGSNEGTEETPTPTGESKVYTLGPVSDPNISGTATFAELSDGSTTVTLELTGTPDGGMHPAHIHMNTAVEGGDIAISLTTVDGSTGQSVTTVDTTNAGETITYDELLEYDGYINVHLSAEDLATLVAQGDIGQNELTGESKSYTLAERAVDGISGTALFEQRVNGEALATLALEGTPEDGEHPAHIHMNTAVEGGGIVFTFTPVNGATGMSMTNVAVLDDESAFGYDDVLTYDGYINVHLSANELGTIVAQGDIGQNELTGESKSYTLEERAVDGISGTAMFEERVNGEALATLMLDGTPDDGEHPAHIHMNTAVEGGDIAFTFTPVDGATGMSMTNVAELDDESAFGYSDVLTYDGYINVHLSANELATIVAQGDIGQNELTGETKVYELEERDVAGISGTATFAERVNGEALATLALEGTPEDGEHPAHIHMNSAAETGPIVFTFTPVDGATGMSMTNVAVLDDESAFGYDDVLTYDGYINVHLSANELGTIVAQGNIGSNEEEEDGDAGDNAINYDVTNEGTTAYVFNGSGLDGVQNPDLTLKRGETYTFTVDASGHPFFIKSVQGNGNANAYETGVTGNGSTDGVVTFVVPQDAPNTLYYNCEFHAAMTGTLTITD